MQDIHDIVPCSALPANWSSHHFLTLRAGWAQYTSEPPRFALRLSGVQANKGKIAWTDSRSKTLVGHCFMSLTMATVPDIIYELMQVYLIKAELNIHVGRSHASHTDNYSKSTKRSCSLAMSPHRSIYIFQQCTAHSPSASGFVLLPIRCNNDGVVPLIRFQ